MTTPADFASALASALGPLYRVSVVGADGETVAMFGTAEITNGTKTSIPFPDSPYHLFIEVDVQAIESADRLLHALAEPHRLAETPLGALTNLEDALDQLIIQGEARVGKPLGQMSRTEKQQLVRFLDERGAFQLRKAVERLADILGVSRFTIYNYLEAARTS